MKKGQVRLEGITLEELLNLLDQQEYDEDVHQCDCCGYDKDGDDEEYGNEVVNEFSFGDLLRILLLFSDIPTDMEEDIYNMTELQIISFASELPSKNFQEKNEKLTNIVSNLLDIKREAGLL